MKNLRFNGIHHLENHVLPKIGELPVSQITSSDILGVLSPIWNTRTDTARKLKQRIRLIIKWARAKGYFQGDDPVELAEQALPRKKRSDNHHKSLSYKNVPDLIVKIKESKNQSSYSTCNSIYYSFRMQDVRSA